MTTVLDAPGHAQFDLWGGQAEVIAPSDCLLTALDHTRQVISEVDASCSTFRDDSDISRVNHAAGSWVRVGPMFLQILRATLDLAVATGGRLDPTAGTAHLHIRHLDVRLQTATYRHIEVAEDRVRVPRHARLDLGATAKAWAADEAAARAHRATEAPILVGLCGDIGTAGQPGPTGWTVVCGDDHRDPESGPHSIIAISDGGLATSSLSVRRTSAGGHIIDPVSGWPVVGPWRTVSVAAASCLQANAAATAAVVMGATAPEWLTSLHLPARLVRIDGTVHTTKGWPDGLV